MLPPGGRRLNSGLCSAEDGDERRLQGRLSACWPRKLLPQTKGTLFAH